MTRRRNILLRIQTFGEIHKILGSMKSLAYMETRKLVSRLENQRVLLQAIENAARDFLYFHPLSSADEPLRILIAIGSERGFCGDMNEKMLEYITSRSVNSINSASKIISVGYRLCDKLHDHPLLAAAVGGANTIEEIDQVLAQIVNILESLRELHGPLSLTAIFLRHECDHVTSQTLLPPFEDAVNHKPSFAVPPLLYLQPYEFFLKLTDQFLLAALHEILYSSLMAENLRRVQHLDGALSFLNKRLEMLNRKDRQLRQEEIIEDIEVILLGSTNTQV